MVVISVGMTKIFYMIHSLHIYHEARFFSKMVKTEYLIELSSLRIYILVWKLLKHIIALLLMFWNNVFFLNVQHLQKLPESFQYKYNTTVVLHSGRFSEKAGPKVKKKEIWLSSTELSIFSKFDQVAVLRRRTCHMSRAYRKKCRIQCS